MTDLDNVRPDNAKPGGVGPGGAGPSGVSRRFDPRFSPAFQPGYDPRVHREEPPSAPLREEPRPEWADVLAPRRPESPTRTAFGAGAFSPGAVEPAASSPERFGLAEFGLGEGRSERPDELLGAAAVPEEADDLAEPQPWWQRFNPWFVALWVIGLALILFAFWSVNLVADIFTNGPGTGFDSRLLQLLSQMVFYGSPMLVVLGLATLTSTVVILAARWKRPSR